MNTQFKNLADQAAALGSVSAADVLSLRREGWGDGIITREEAEALFAVNNALSERNEEWSDFFVEAISEYVLNGTEPRRQCDVKEASWLIAQVDHDGVLESMVELETLVHIIDRAENTPEQLKHYVLQQIEREVLTGTGPTRCGGELSATHVSAAECRILRRVIFAGGGDGPAAVSRFEAEMLFRLKDKTLAEENAPDWDELFLDGVSNYLKGFALGNAQLSHGRKLELEQFIGDNEANVARFMGAVVREAPRTAGNFANAMGVVFGKRRGGAISERAAAEVVARAEAGAEVTDAEQEWLNQMIEADGEVDDLERRLIARIIEEG